MEFCRSNTGANLKNEYSYPEGEPKVLFLLTDLKARFMDIISMPGFGFFIPWNCCNREPPIFNHKAYPADNR